MAAPEPPRTYDPTGGPPTVPTPTTRLPLVWMWLVPFFLVAAYVVLVGSFFHGDARWSGERAGEVAALLLTVTLVFSFLWYGSAYGAALGLGPYVPLGVLLFIARLPGLRRHAVVTPPSRPDTPREVWGRFAILLLILLGFELLLMIVIVRRGELGPDLVLGRPTIFFRDEAITGLLLAAVLAPVGAFLASRLRTRITDSLEFPLLWLAVLLLVIGGVGVLVADVLPGAIVDPGLFLVSVLFYAPAAWYVALAFMRSEPTVQNRFLRRAWGLRGGRFHFGRIQVTDEPAETTTEV